MNWNLGGGGVLNKNVVLLEKANEIEVPTEGELPELKGSGAKGNEVAANSGDEFDADEEEAMIQAAIEIETQEDKKRKGKNDKE